MSAALRCDACGNYAHENTTEWFHVQHGQTSFWTGMGHSWHACSWACIGLLAIGGQEQEKETAA